MRIEKIAEKMIAFSEGNLHDIEHFLKVYAYAKTIGELEGLNEDEQYVLEASALVHDIACPFCRLKYGDTAGKHQEAESEMLLLAFFDSTDIAPEALKRIIHIVSHHHTYENVDSREYRILLEADFLVNASESNMSRSGIENAKNIVFRTESGINMLEKIYLRRDNNE